MIFGRLNFGLALRELQYSGKKLFTVLFILSLGLFGPLFAGSLRTSVDTYLTLKSRQMLSADLAVGAMRPFKADELKEITRVLTPLKQTSEIEFVTMARGSEKSSGQATLVEVKAEDPQFPIFGEFTFKGGKTIANAEPLSSDQIAWVYPEVLAQLGLKVGDRLAVGQTSFLIQGELEEAPGQGRTGGFAPRIYIGRKFVEQTKLTQVGSQVFHRVYVELPRGVSSDTGASFIKDALQDPDIFLRTPDDAIQGFDRFFHFFSLYLGAVIMIVFALSWAGAFYILQIYLQDRLKNAAIFLINGASRTRTSLLYFTQVLTLIALAFIIAGLAVQLAMALFLPEGPLGTLLPKGFVLKISGADLFSLALVAAGSAVAFTGPFFARLYQGRLHSLLGESSLGVQRLPFKLILLSYAPSLAVFLGLSVWLMGGWRDALFLAVGVAFAGTAGVAVGRGLFRGFFRSVKGTPGLTRLIATMLARSRFGMNLCFLALVLVSLSMNIVPHMLSSIVHEVLPIQGKEIPAFFLFNIPETQVDDLKKFAIDEKAELRFLSPMVLGRLVKVNGEPTRSDQFQRFPVRLSYRQNLIDSETLTAGHALPQKYDPDQPAEISVESKFADRNQLKLGDKVEFDIQGVPVETKITSLRKVKWTNFNPNFFIMFQPGVLDDAPKTYLANVNLDGGDEAKTKLQFELVKKFPDLSVIDIGRTISRVLEVARSVIGPVTAAAWIAVFMSFLILIGIIGHNLRMRYPEVDIEKLLGADSLLIRKLLTGEYFVTALFAWVVGSASALALAWYVVSRVLDVQLQISWLALAVSCLCTVVITTLIAWFAAGTVLRLRGASRKL